MFMPEDTRNCVYRASGAALAVQPQAPMVAPAVPEPDLDPSAEASEPAPPAGEESELASFKRTVARFVATDRQIAELSAQLKAVRAENSEVRDEICKFMGEREFEDLRTKDMRLRLKTAAVKPPLKKAELHERVAAYLGSEAAAAAFFEKVYNEREAVQRTSLRRLRVRA